jgi:3-oxoacyl-[acyl-carrier protein] reductase
MRPLVMAELWSATERGGQSFPILASSRFPARAELPVTVKEAEAMDLHGTVSLVTGGNGGLGRRICHALAAAGSHVAVVCRSSREDAEGVAVELRELGVQAEVFLADVTVRDEIIRLYDEVLQSFGQIDILVNNAAYNQAVAFKDLEGLTPEVWDTILTANTTGPFLCTREIAPIMKRQGRGRIVNISSVAGFTPTGSSIAYAVSKSALNHLARCMAVALAPEVLVNCVAPGLMEGTRMTARLHPDQVKNARAGALIGKAAERDDVADQVVAFVRSDSTTGQTLVIDGGRYFH